MAPQSDGPFQSLLHEETASIVASGQFFVSREDWNHKDFLFYFADERWKSYEQINGGNFWWNNDMIVPFVTTFS